MDELTFQIKQEDIVLKNSQNSNIKNMLISNSEEENFEVNKFSEERFVDVHEAKNEKFEKLAESGIKSGCEFGKDPLYVSEKKTIKKTHERKGLYIRICMYHMEHMYSHNTCLYVWNLYFGSHGFGWENTNQHT